jgi:acetyl esterase/lipase
MSGEEKTAVDPRKALVAANETPEGAILLYARQAEAGAPYSCEYLPDVTYATYGERTMRLQIVRPMALRSKVPLILFIQGSGWKKQTLYFQIPNLSIVAARGYVVASVEYRETPDARFPAQLEDVKCAIRFLRANADRFGIDPERVGVWGDSSGGHLSLMTGLTPGRYRNEPFPDVRDDVAAVVDYYGISDLLSLGKFNDYEQHDAATSPEAMLIGGSVLEKTEEARRASPIHQPLDVDLPPFLIVHGDCDAIIHIDQSYGMYHALRRAGQDVQLVKVLGADHIFGMWTPEVLDLTARFFDRHLKRPLKSLWTKPEEVLGPDPNAR